MRIKQNFVSKYNHDKEIYKKLKLQKRLGKRFIVHTCSTSVEIGKSLQLMSISEIVNIQKPSA